MAIRKSWEYPIEEDCLNSKEVAMSSISLRGMVTPPPFVTKLQQIATAVITAKNKTLALYLQNKSDATTPELLARLAVVDGDITARDSARLKAEAARLAALAEASA